MKAVLTRDELVLDGSPDAALVHGVAWSHVGALAGGGREVWALPSNGAGRLRG